MSPLPPAGRDAERQRHRPQHGHDENAGDQSRVHSAEPERAGKLWTAPHHDDECEHFGDRPEQPAVVEEPFVSHSRVDCGGAEHSSRVEMMQVEVGGYLRPPQSRGSEYPHECRDG